MIGFEFGLGDVGALAARWSPAHRAALRRAFRAELYRLKVAETAALRGGIEPRRRAPLTRAVSPSRSTRALSAFAPLTAYELREAGDTLEGVVGLTARGARRQTPPPVDFLGRALAGGPETLTREKQGALAARLRARGVSERRLARILPAEGSSTFTPARDFVGQVEAREVRGKTLRNIAGLYRRALAGERWKAGWWKE